MRIRRIGIHNWGPIGARELEFPEGLTLVWGENSAGKSTILEALLMSLAKDPDEVFAYLRRDPEFVGSAWVELEANGRLVRRSYPSKGRSSKGGHTQRLRLLFSWPGEAYREGLLSEMLTGLLLPQELLNWNPLQGTGVEDVVGGRIKGARRGAFRRWLELLDERERLLALEREIFSFSGVELMGLEEEISALERELSAQQEAKRALAGQLYLRLEEVQREIASIPTERMERISQLLSQRRQLEELLRSGRREEEEIREEDWLWWRSVLSRAESLPGWIPALKGLDWLGWVGLGLGVGIVAVMWGIWDWLGVVLILVGVGMEVLSRRGWGSFARWIEEKTGRSFGSREQLREFVKELEGLYHRQQAVREEKERLRTRLKACEAELSSLVEGDPVRYLEELKERRGELERSAREIQEELSRLGVAREEAGDVATDLPYDPEKERRLREALEDLYQKRTSLKDRLQRTLVALSAGLGVEETSLKRLFVALRKRLEAVEEELKDLSVRFVSGVAWKRVLDRFRKEQFREVSQIVSSEEFTAYLRRITAGAMEVRRVIVEGGDIVFHLADGREYRFSLLSSGVRHQVLLAFKFALLERVYDEPGFIIMDDAFVFSDWERLKAEVEFLRQVSSEGWQVIYFSCDRATRELLESAGARLICL